MVLARLVDSALDRSLLGGYGAPGLRIRQALPGWPADPGRLDGKAVIVTGATAGIGLAAAQGFADLGARVHLVGRDERRTLDAAAAVGAVPEICDVSSLASVRALIDRWEGPLDVLVHNAGVMPPERVLTDDGVELTFATNVLGPWLLTRDLAPSMPAGGRVVNVSSGGMYGQALDADHFQNDDYAPVKAYARTKRAEVILTAEWAARLPRLGVHAMHPGWAATPGIQTSLPTFGKLVKPILRTPAQGADTIVWLGATVGLPSGLFWHDRRPRPVHQYGRGRSKPGADQALWDLCEELAG